MSVDDVIEHLNKHDTYIDPSGNVRSQDPIHDKLFKLMLSFEDWWDLITAQYNGQIPDRFALQSITTVSKQILEILKFQADLQGRVGPNNEHQIIEIRASYEMLVGVIMAEGCDSCKSKVVECLERANNGAKQLTTGNHR